MSDDYENDFDDFDDDGVEEVGPASGVKGNSGYDYQPGGGTSNSKPSFAGGSKPLAGGSKPDWLKNNNSKPFAAKPAYGAGNTSTQGQYNPRKADSISVNRINPRRNPSQEPTSKTAMGGDYDLSGKNSKPGSKQKKKKRDFSVNLPPKPKKINLPKDYLDKYTKNNPVRDLERSLKEIKDNIKNLQKELQESQSITNDLKRQKALQRINKELRGELKKLSENSTILCDELQKKHYKKKKTPRKIDGETELKIKNKELENADKLMNNLLTEYNTVKKRIEQVSDFNYAVDLKSKIAENKQTIKDNNKKIKELEQDQKKRDIQMNRMLKEEKSEKMRRVDYKHSKLTYLQEKINEMQVKIEHLEKEKQEKDEQEQDIRQKYEAMLRIGEHYGINENNIDNEEDIFKNKLMEEYEKVIQIESMEKQYKIEIKEKKKMIKEYTDKKKNATKELGTVVNDILGKAEQLNGLIEKMRGFGMGEDILNRWAEENKQLIETASPKRRLKEDKAPAPKKVEKPIVANKPSISNKPTIAEKNKPFGMMKKNDVTSRASVNQSQDNIEEDVPEMIEEKVEEKKEKPQAKPTKPFGNMGSKATKPFGKPFSKPFGNATNTGNNANSSVADNASNAGNQDPPKQAPLSFTEKYGLANKEEPKADPIPTLNQDNSQSKMNNAPWMRNKPTLGENNNAESAGGYIPSMGGNQNTANNNSTGDYIPTIGSGPRRVGRPPQNQSAIPTMGEEKKNDTNIDRIPTLNDQPNNGSQIGTMPRRIGQPSGSSQIGSLPRRVGPASTNDSQIGTVPRRGQEDSKNDINKIPMIGSSNRDPIDNIPMMGGSNNDPIDNIPTLNSGSNDPINNIPTIGESNNNSRRRPMESNDTGGYIPSGMSNQAEEKPLPGGRRRVADPFSKASNDPPNSSNKPFPFGENNISRISNNSGTNNNSLFQSNRNEKKPGNFVDNFSGGNDKKEPPKKNDFWGGILGGDKPPAPTKKPNAPKPVPSGIQSNNRAAFQDVASLDDEFMLD
ncbi:unnamed protein product [Moneuplotes crassus]|uniref:Uncharacterized protein n=1 Tax=Euplotes crassus TaxID=5936 RepID=A0AAD1XU72_EUPCR|nr:unnamed protein product [Moneuplotes crassus]